MKYSETGHAFLARIGKKILRPGGKKGTKFLLKHTHITKKTHILEVACNRGELLIDLYTKYQCALVGIDNNPLFLKLAKEHVKSKGLNNNILLQEADASNIPYPDNTFDIIINQAMLTMIPHKQLPTILNEYYRVLKPGGILLTHDLAIVEENENLIRELRELVIVEANPKKPKVWKTFFHKQGFILEDSLIDKLNLINPLGLIKNEGFNTFKILYNGLKKENRTRFKALYKFFNHHKKDFNFICLVNRKPH